LGRVGLVWVAIGLGRVESGWVKSGWVGSSWIDLGWIWLVRVGFGLSWYELGKQGMDCVELGWFGSHLGWVRCGLGLGGFSLVESSWSEGELKPKWVCRVGLGRSRTGS